MKCEACKNQLEAYVDGELSEETTEHLGSHLMSCAECSQLLETLTAEQEIYARYDRGLEIAPAMWNAIEARIAAEPIRDSPFSLSDWFAALFAAPKLGWGLAGAVALIVATVAIGLIYIRLQQPP